jgi:hypothetical protein
MLPILMISANRFIGSSEAEYGWTCKRPCDIVHHFADGLDDEGLQPDIEAVQYAGEDYEENGVEDHLLGRRHHV